MRRPASWVTGDEFSGLSGCVTLNFDTWIN
jgi:hypothetical protein